VAAAAWAAAATAASLVFFDPLFGMMRVGEFTVVPLCTHNHARDDGAGEGDGAQGMRLLIC